MRATNETNEIEARHLKERLKTKVEETDIRVVMQSVQKALREGSSIPGAVRKAYKQETLP